MNIPNAKRLLAKVGEVMKVENPIVEGKILRTFIRGRVTIDLNLSLLGVRF